MGRDGVTIVKAGPGSNALQGSDSTSGIIVQVVEGTNIVLGEIYEFTTLKQAENKGITEAYDSDNAILVWYHVKEFFRLSKEGTKLFFMGAPRDKAFSDLVQDLDAEYGMKLTAKAKGEIRQLAFAFNPAENYVASHSSGLDEEVFDCIAAGQDLYNRLYNLHRPCQVVLEGRDIGALDTLPDLRNLPGLQAQKVTLCIGQDYEYAHSLDSKLQKHAAIGTLLGTVAKTEVSQSIGETATMNLSSVIQSAFTAAGVSSHTSLDDIEPFISDLDAKGYVFPIAYTGFDGFYWVGEHVCTPVVIDREGNMNEHSISIGRTLDKATRLLRTAYLPIVQSRQPVDPKTGQLPTAIIETLSEIGNTELRAMKNKEEISGGVAIVDPESDLLSPPKSLNVAFKIVPYGIVGDVIGTINVQEAL